MRKKLLILGMVTCLAFSVSACGKDDKSETTAASEKESSKKDDTIKEKGEIKLAAYKGLAAYEDDIAVSDSDLEKYINDRLALDAVTEYQEEGTVEADMKVKVSYKGTIDGKEFTGGTSEGTVITISDSGFSVKGFTEGLKGHKVGDVVELDLKMPDDYSDEKLKGKDVHYSVTINSIVVTVVPNLNDEYVEKEYGGLDLHTVGEFKEYLKNDLYINNVYQQVWPQIVEDTEVISYCKEDYDEYFTTISENYEYQIYSSYGYKLEDYLKAVSSTKEEWDAKIDTTVKSTLKEEMIIDEIAKAEKIKITDEQFDRKMLEYAKLYGYDTVEAFKEQYSSITDEQFQFSVKAYFVQNYVAEQASIQKGSNPSKETTTSAETTAADKETTAEEETTTAQ